MTKRDAKVYKSLGNRHLAIDSVTEDEIMEFIGQSDAYGKKFIHIVDAILNNLRVPDLYDKEDINERCKDVTAMKFFKNGKGNTANGRLYCKEIKDGDKIFVVVASQVLRKKKNQKNGAIEISLIEQVASHQYNIIYEQPDNQ